MKFLESLKVVNPSTGATEYFKNMIGPNSFPVSKEKGLTQTN